MSAAEQIVHLAAAEAVRILPYLLAGVAVSEAARYTAGAELLERIAARRPRVAIALAAVLGMLSPLCTYGTVPVVLQLLRAGMPSAPLITFLATSSLMNPQLFLMTWGGLGPELALARLAAVFGFGALLGAALHFLPARMTLLPALAREAKTPRARKPFTVRGYLRRCLESLEFVGFYVLAGVFLGASLEVLVPGRWILLLVGGNAWWQVMLAALLGVPLYACGGGTIPLVGSLMAGGMSRGAAIAFLIAGPATRVPPLMALATLVRPRIVAAYVAFLLVFAALAGAVYGSI